MTTPTDLQEQLAMARAEQRAAVVRHLPDVGKHMLAGKIVDELLAAERMDARTAWRVLAGLAAEQVIAVRNGWVERKSA